MKYQIRATGVEREREIPTTPRAEGDGEVPPQNNGKKCVGGDASIVNRDP